MHVVSIVISIDVNWQNAIPLKKIIARTWLTFINIHLWNRCYRLFLNKVILEQSNFNALMNSCRNTWIYIHHKPYMFHSVALLMIHNAIEATWLNFIFCYLKNAQSPFYFSKTLVSKEKRITKFKEWLVWLSIRKF